MSTVFVNTHDYTAHACSCMQPLSPDEELPKYDAVFSGKVTQVVEKNSSWPSTRSTYSVFVTFDVKNVWKGVQQETLVVKTANSSASCGFFFEENREYMVYATAYDGVEYLEVNSCSRTGLLSDAIEEIDELGPGYSMGSENKPRLLLPPPLKQFKSGIPAKEIQCNDGLHLIIKHDNTPACIKEDSILKLDKRGGILFPTTSSFLDVEPNSWDFRKVTPVVTIPQNSTGPSPESGPIPDSIVIDLRETDSILLFNESDIPLKIKSYEDNSWYKEIGPEQFKRIKFNSTGHHEYLIEDLLHGVTSSGEVIVLDKYVELLPIEEKLLMAQSILSTKEWSDLPLVGVGAGNAEKILDVRIHEDELEKFPDAKKHYEKIVRELIPFEVPIKIEFDGFAVHT